MIDHRLTYNQYRVSVLLPAPARMGERIAFEDHVVEVVTVTHVIGERDKLIYIKLEGKLI